MEKDELAWRRKRRKRRKNRRRKQFIRGIGAILALFCCILVTGNAIYRFAQRPAPAEADQQQQEASADLDADALSSEEVPVSQPEEEEEAPPPVEVDPNSIIYLTFDDGPSSKVTEQILDILKENDIKATFFILNYSKSSIPILQRMAEEGHTIGLHGMSHEYVDCYSTEDAYLDGIDQLRDKLYDDTGYYAFCLRFPGGSSNTISRRYNEGIMTRLTQRVNEDPELQYFDWNVDSEDATGTNVDAELLVSNVTSELVKGKSNVVLMHDADTKETTAEALQAIIDYGRANGYCFQAITRDTPTVHHPVNN